MIVVTATATAGVREKDDRPCSAPWWWASAWVYAWVYAWAPAPCVAQSLPLRGMPWLVDAVRRSRSQGGRVRNAGGRRALVGALVVGVCVGVRVGVRVGSCATCAPITVRQFWLPSQGCTDRDHGARAQHTNAWRAAGGWRGVGDKRALVGTLVVGVCVGVRVGVCVGTCAKRGPITTA